MSSDLAVPTLSARDLRLRNPGLGGLLAEAEREAQSMKDATGLRGWGTAVLFDGDGKLRQVVPFANLITRIGDAYYGERAAGIASPPAQVTGMQLGTGGATPVAKTGAGSAVVTVVANSLLAIDGGFPTSALSGSSRRIQWKTSWGPGTATANGINEAVLVNQATGTQTAAPEANTIARTILGTTVNKSPSDSLALTWNNDLLGT